MAKLILDRLASGYAVRYVLDLGVAQWWACDEAGVLVSKHALPLATCEILARQGALVLVREVSPTAQLFRLGQWVKQ